MTTQCEKGKTGWDGEDLMGKRVCRRSPVVFTVYGRILARSTWRRGMYGRRDFAVSGSGDAAGCAMVLLRSYRHVMG